MYLYQTDFYRFKSNQPNIEDRVIVEFEYPTEYQWLEGEELEHFVEAAWEALRKVLKDRTEITGPWSSWLGGWEFTLVKEQ